MLRTLIKLISRNIVVTHVDRIRKVLRSELIIINLMK